MSKTSKSTSAKSEPTYGEAAARLEEILGTIEEGEVDIDALSGLVKGGRRARDPVPRQDPRGRGAGQDDHRAARAGKRGDLAEPRRLRWASRGRRALMTAEEIFRGRLVMAPMTRGTDLPFRRLATEWGAQVCVGEMAYAHKIVKRDRAESALIRRHPDENIFGVQLAGKHPEVMAEAARIAEQAGADFVDVNLGCPIDEAVRRGFGAALLGRATRVADIVSAMKSAVAIPVTLKLRLGWSSEKPTFLKIARAAQEAGADAIALHPRSRAQRYRRPADWSAVRQLVEELSIPVIGNGDILTWSDAVPNGPGESGCAAVMVGRWALTKPWIFREFSERRELEMDADDRVKVLSRYVELCREHFRDDERGRVRIRRFLTFHQDFFRRYRRGARGEAVNSDDPRDWGHSPDNELEAWLCRADHDANDALCRWLVDGEVPEPPPDANPDAPRAVKLAVYG